MSIKVTPEVRTVVCDCCQREIGINGVRRAQNGSLKLLRDLLDWQGYPCASGNISLDLCDSCLADISNAINATCTVIRNSIAARATPNETKETGHGDDA